MHPDTRSARAPGLLVMTALGFDRYVYHATPHAEIVKELAVRSDLLTLRDDERAGPVRPEPAEDDPENTITGTKSGTFLSP